jgi:hypothetical protein
MLGALGILLLATDAPLAQPALIDWSCTAWRSVELTMLNPFGRECTQWTLRQPANFNQIPPPPIAVQRAQPNEAAADKAKPNKEEKPKQKQKPKSGHSR